MVVFASFDLGSTIGIGATILGLAAIIGGVIAVLRVNVSKTTTDLYRQDNDALRARLTTEVEEGKRKDADLAVLRGQLQEKDRENATLRDMVTGTSAIDRLADNIAGHFLITESLLRQVVGEDAYRASLSERNRILEEERAKKTAAPEGTT